MITNDLISNPIGWEDKAVGTNIRFLILVVLHIFVGVMFSQQDWGLILFISFFPIMYLYALKKVLEALKSKP